MMALQNQIQTLIQENEQQHKHYDKELATLRTHHKENL